MRQKGSALLLAIAMMFSVSSCDFFDLDINQNPNTPAQASLDLLLANVQFNASSTFAGGLNDMAMGFMAMNTSVDDFNMTNSSWNGTWNFLYTGPLKDLEGIIVATKRQRDAGTPNPHYEGIAKVLKAYYFTMMVDLWGSVPYSEAFLGDVPGGTITPNFTNGSEIYADAITLLDEAMANLAEASPVTARGDLIYGGGSTTAAANITRWRRAANSLKLRLLLQTRLIDPAAKRTAIEAVLASPIGVISAAADDFQFQFGNTGPNPENRHPMWQSGYAGGEAGYTYFGHEYMYEMLRKNDPRRPFYFKRQTSSVLDPNDATDKQTIPCSQRTDCRYGYFPLSNFVTQGIYGKSPAALTDAERSFLAGFFGRDRSDPSGVPNDNSLRTNVGVYPAGGLYDDGPELGGGNKGSGAGIFPMVTSWMVKLYQAEAILTLGVTSATTPRALFEAAMREQIAKVNSIGTSLDAQSVAITAAQINTYVNARLAEYDAATSDDARLRVILAEARFLNFGNGFEAYNAFRRTGYPANLQPPLQLPRNFALRLPYAQDEINLNPNTPEIVYDNPEFAVFWDQLKFQF